MTTQTLRPDDAGAPAPDLRPFVRLLAAAAAANVVAAQFLHEVGHWLVFALAGRRPVWGITAMVQLWDRSPVDPSSWTRFVDPDGDVGWFRLGSVPTSDVEWTLFLAAGPSAQLVAIGVGLWLGARAAAPAVRIGGVLVAFVNGLTLLLYQGVAALRGGGSDETLLAVYTGLPWWLFAGLFGGLAAAGLVAAVARLANVRTRLRWFGAVFLGAVATGPLFASLQSAIIDGVDRGHPLFVPIAGFSLPVVVLAIGGALALVGLLRRTPASVPR